MPFEPTCEATPAVSPDLPRQAPAREDVRDFAFPLVAVILFGS